MRLCPDDRIGKNSRKCNPNHNNCLNKGTYKFTHTHTHTPTHTYKFVVLILFI